MYVTRKTVVQLTNAIKKKEKALLIIREKWGILLFFELSIMNNSYTFKIPNCKIHSSETDSSSEEEWDELPVSFFLN